jgi:microcystin degradation protein MlrC
MARIAIAGFIHETNTFSPLPTGYEDFDTQGSPTARLLLGEEMLPFLGIRMNNAACGFANRAVSNGNHVVPILWTAAEPANQVCANAFERIMAMMVAGLSKQGPLDGVFLDLHGAMVYEGYNDGETEILRRVRAIVGDIPIVVALDLHGNIDPCSVTLASAMIGYRTYPHLDMYETGERCASVMQYLLESKPLYQSFRQIPFLIPLSLQSTDTEPCKKIFESIKEIERRPAVVSASILLGFPPADMEHTGPSVIAYAESPAAAQAGADSLFQLMMEQESKFSLDLLNASQAVRKGIQISMQANKPVILADIQDNPGAGGTSDTPWLLAALSHHQAYETAIGMIYDPEVAEAAHAAKVGAEVALGLGGKRMPGQKPFDAKFKVVNLFEGEFTLTGSLFQGVTVNLGKMAHLQIGGIHVVVASKRTQAADPMYFRIVGIEPEQMKIVVLKSSNHFRADFAPIASVILPVEAPGAVVEDPGKATYQNLRKGIRLIGKGPIYHGSLKR